MPDRREEDARATGQVSLLEPALALLRKKTKDDLTENIEMLRGRYFWEEDGCRKDSSISVGRMKVNAKPATIAQRCEVRREISEAFKKREPQRSGNGKEVL